MFTLLALGVISVFAQVTETAPAPADSQSGKQSSDGRGYVAPQLEVLEVGPSPLIDRYCRVTLRQTIVRPDGVRVGPKDMNPILFWQHDFRLREALPKVGVGGKLLWRLPVHFLIGRRQSAFARTDLNQEIFEVIAVTPLTETEIAAYDLWSSLDADELAELNLHHNASSTGQEKIVHALLGKYFGRGNAAIPHWSRNQQLAREEVAGTRSDLKSAVWALQPEFSAISAVRTKMRERPTTKIAAAARLLATLSTDAAQAESYQGFFQLPREQMERALQPAADRIVAPLIEWVITELQLEPSRINRMAVPVNDTLLADCNTSYAEDAAREILRIAWQQENAKGTGPQLNVPKLETIAAFKRLLGDHRLQLTGGIALGGGVPDQRIVVFYTAGDPTSAKVLQAVARIQKQQRLPARQIWALNVIPDSFQSAGKTSSTVDPNTSSFARNFLSAQEMRSYLQSSTTPRIYLLRRHDLVFEAKGESAAEQLTAFLNKS